MKTSATLAFSEWYIPSLASVGGLVVDSRGQNFTLQTLYIAYEAATTV